MMTQKEFNELKKTVDSMVYNRSQYTRKGQALYICVNSVFFKKVPDIYNILNKIGIDPFYNDTLIPEFWEALQKELVY